MAATTGSDNGADLATFSTPALVGPRATDATGHSALVSPPPATAHAVAVFAGTLL
ncbi:hypothetical protein ACPPVO_20985 [Dactylosporangium sp. McL0621]|uniref:hypothetical protein n=1 Tax=Dactylosporangium sp. McL0621 TaxID=3415678 RepID=UPI003CEC84CE